MKRNILIIILVLAAVFVALNYIAANHAGKKIDKSIKTQVDSLDTSLSVSYSKVHVGPFSGNINFSNVKLQNKMSEEQIHHLQLDLSYFDFLRIYFGGPKHGLKKLSSAKIHFKKISYLNHQSHRNISFGTLNISYHGNVWDAIQTLQSNKSLKHSQRFDIKATGLRYSNPNDSLGIFKSDSVHFHYVIPKTVKEKKQLRNSIQFANITWLLPAHIKNKYGLFIQGFGFPADSIPIAKTGCHFSGLSHKNIKVENGQIKTEPFTIKFDGNIVKDSTWSAARLAPMNIAIVNFSKKIKSELSGFGFFKTKGSKKKQNITFKLKGPISSPRVIQNK